ncbi:unnamed protein product [Malus baccata var. baccata]
MGLRKHVIDSAVDALRFQGVSVIFSLPIFLTVICSNYIDIDAVGTFRVCHEALKYLKMGASGKKNSSAGGSVINISATLHYTATWYQIHVCSKGLVNGIAPGPVGDTAGFSKLLPQEMLSKPKEQILVSKLGQKWDIAMAALYPSSDAGKYINGTRLVVDGGEWQTKPAHSPEEAVKQPSRAVERSTKLQTLYGMHPQGFRHINDLVHTLDLSIQMESRSPGDMLYLKNTPPWTFGGTLVSQTENTQPSIRLD